MPLNDNDLLLINDSQDSNEAKKIKYSTLKSNITGDQDLQAVTDNGSTTTNGATFGGGSINLDVSGAIDLTRQTEDPAGLQFYTKYLPGGVSTITCGIRPDGVYIGTNLTDVSGPNPSDQNISLNADGSASFAGDVSVGGLVSTKITEVRAYDPKDVTYGNHIAFVGTDTSTSHWCPIRLIADSDNAQNTSVSIQAVENANNRADFTIVTYAAGGATEKVRINDAGNLMLGGNLPDSPNITLNADGTAKISSYIHVGEPSQAAGKNGAYIAKETDNSQLVIYSNLALNSAADKPPIMVWSSPDASTTKTARFAVNTDGTTKIVGTGTVNVPNISLNADGSASFASSLVDIRKINDAGSGNDYGRIDIDGKNIGNVPAFSIYNSLDNSGTTSNQFIIQTDGGVRIGGTNANPNISLNADGSGSFAGAVQTDGAYQGNFSGDYLPTSTLSKAALLRGDQVVFANQDGSTYYGHFDAAGTLRIGGSAAAGNNVVIDADGSATFEGQLTTKTGMSLIGNSAIRTFSNDDGIRFAVSNNAGNVNTVEINNDGSATFAGTVTVNGNRPLLLGEGADQVDVKDRLTTLATRLSAIENADITDDAEHSALLTLVANLATRVTALEQGGN